MIQLKTPEELHIMQKGGVILSETLAKLLKEAHPGMKLSDLDKMAEDFIIARGGEPSFKKVKDYQWTICACVNDIVVHGIPTDYKLREGDILGLDCGVYYKGFHTDAARTVRVGNTKLKEEKDHSKGITQFLDIGEKALIQALEQVREGNYIYDISQTIQKIIENSGFSIVKTLVGHGVGRNLHEDPEIPGYVKDERKKTPRIISGMALAVEVIYNMGTGDVVYRGDDGWTIVTRDGKISGLFESTVVVFPHGSLVLTPVTSEYK